MAEAQALNRVHRIGQEREVTVRRYIVKDTIENVNYSPSPLVFLGTSQLTPSQYIRWVQSAKLRLVSQAFDSAEISQDEIEEERWVVRNESALRPYS